MLNFSFPYICWKFIFHSYDELFWRWFYICGLFSFANGRMLENSQQINALQNVQLLSFFPLNLSPNSFQFLNTELRLVEKLLARFVICTWVIPPPPFYVSSTAPGVSRDFHFWLPGGRGSFRSCLCRWWGPARPLQPTSSAAPQSPTRTTNTIISSVKLKLKKYKLEEGWRGWKNWIKFYQ